MRDTYIDPLYKHMGDLIRAKREERGLSQAELASLIAMNRVSIINIESGKQRPPLHVLWLIAFELGFELRDFVPLKETVESGPFTKNPVLEGALKKVSPRDRGAVTSLYLRVTSDK